MRFLREDGRLNKAIWSARTGHERRLVRRVKVAPKAYYAYAQKNPNLRNEVGPLRDGSRLLGNDDEVAGALVSHFERVHRTDALNTTPPILEFPQLESMEEIVITPEEVRAALRRLKVDKAEGCDGIHPRLLRLLADIIYLPLASLYQRSLAEGQIVEDWRTARVTAIHKGGAKDKAGNYRPISLTSVVLKVLERIVRDRIASFLICNDLISKAQHGFMKGRSCLTNLSSLLDEATARLDKMNKVEVWYLDFIKAFDSMKLRFL